MLALRWMRFVLRLDWVGSTRRLSNLFALCSAIWSIPPAEGSFAAGIALARPLLNARTMENETRTNRRLPLLLVLSLASVAACATPYQQMGYRGGFEDAWIRDDTYFLNVQTNAFTSQLVAAQYFHRRARELCYEHGYQDYKIVNERDTSGAFGSYGGGVATVSPKPGLSGYVECIRGPAGPPPPAPYAYGGYLR